MCAYHCAVYRFEDGVCIDGPAVGLRLDALPIEVVDGEVRLREA
jgi:nitrite reductase/ring-hydroxylating ferredoxin subunit